MPHPKTILAIDDDIDFLSIIKISVELYGQSELTICDNGQQGCELAMTHPYDLIMTDLIMPGLDGSMVIEKLRKSSHNSKSLIFILTSVPDVAQAFQIENVEVIAKPIEPQTFVRQIETAWDSYQKRISS